MVTSVDRLETTQAQQDEHSIASTAHIEDKYAALFIVLL